MYAQAQATRLYFAVHSGHLEYASHPSPPLGPDGGIVVTVDVHAAQLGKLVHVVALCIHGQRG